MFDERAYIAQFECADTDETAQMLQNATEEQEKALRLHLGHHTYRRLRDLAIRRNLMQSGRRPIGNVVIIPDIMGSRLAAIDLEGNTIPIWPNALRIAEGYLEKLTLKEDGLHDADPRYTVRDTGILKRYYGILLLTLAEKWSVHAFWYDWRKGLDLAANNLRCMISSWFGEKEPVHIVAHGMGGLVARTFIATHPDRWKSMWDTGETGDGNKRAKRHPGVRGGRLILLGTPNHGLFTTPLILTGAHRTVNLLEKLDTRHSLPE